MDGLSCLFSFKKKVQIRIKSPLCKIVAFSHENGLVSRLKTQV